MRVIKQDFVSIQRGLPLPLTTGSGFAIGRIINDKLEHITVVNGKQPVLYAVTNTQFDSWLKDDLYAYPIILGE